jgi:transaldolase
MLSRIRQVTSLGQAIWLDFIDRALLRGPLRELVDEGLHGITSNPSIFQKAIASGSDYDADLAALARAGKSTLEIYEALAVSDIQAAADQLRPVYNETHSRDGFVSLEVNPHLANDAEGTIAEGRRLWKAVDRPNLMIKVPATEAGLTAITTLIGEGINVNVTLIFALDMYERVMHAYIEGLRKLRDAGKPLSLVSSVASFFISRVDSMVDGILQKRIEAGEDQLEALLGKAAIANAKLAYAKFREVFEGEAFAELRAAGARLQRPLWASTSTKNPKYPGLKYVDPLIGPHTVNTVPPQTLELIRTSAQPGQTIERDLPAARAVMAQLADAKVDMKAVTDQLLTDGLKIFADSFDQMLKDVESKAKQLVKAA